MELTIAIISGVTAIITGGLTLIGVIVSNASANRELQHKLETAQAVTDTKIQELTEEVRKHNAFGDRITRLEMRVQALEAKP